MATAQVRLSGARGAGFARTAEALRQAGRRTLQRELAAALQRAAEPTITAARERARQQLPRRGLGELVAASEIKTKVRYGARPGVTFEARGVNGLDVAAIDKRGFVRHPLFGNRRHWFNQRVTPRWFSGAIERRERAFYRELERAVENVAREVGL